MAEVVFRNAEEDDADDIIRLITSHLLGGNFLWETLGDKGRESALRALVETPDTEYGYEQTTLASRGQDVVGLFIGYPRELLRVLGPRTLSVLMRGRSPLSWPGMIRSQARLARAEPPFPQDSYVVRCVCAVEESLVESLIDEAVAEAVEEECETVVINVFEESGLLGGLLKERGFAEGDDRPISDPKLVERLATARSLQLRLPTGYRREAGDPLTESS